MKKKCSAMLILLGITAMIFSCRSFQKKLVSNNNLPDSLRITVTSTNLSENMTGNDELLIICYLYHDSLKLDEPLFRKNLKIDLKIPSRQFQCKLNQNIRNESLLLFLIEQDSEMPVLRMDSIFRNSHQQIITAFNKRNYAEIQKYLGDEDVLGIKIITQMDYHGANIFYFSGIYKLDKYKYTLRIEGIDN